MQADGQLQYAHVRLKEGGVNKLTTVNNSLDLYQVQKVPARLCLLLIDCLH